MNIQRSDERGSANYGWLRTQYSFSFANYYNPEKVGFGKLLVLNEDHVAGKKGFGMHHHDNMEIVTVVLSGAIEHKDSEGNHGVVKAGEVQRISAGKGILHSEFNPSDKELHLLQIWINTKKKDIIPSYEQKKIALKKDSFTVLVSNAVKSGLHINQDAAILRGKIAKGKKAAYSLKQKKLYVFIIDGEISVKDAILKTGDSAEIDDMKKIEIITRKNSDILLIDIP